jgi:uncharacterized membrane protein
MRYIRYLVLGVLGVVMITVALANRGPLTLRLLPEEMQGLLGLSWQVTMPTFLVLLAAVAFGVVLGFVWEWIREHKHRAEAAAERRARRDLENRLGRMGPAAASAKSGGDDVLALLEERRKAS